MIIKRPHILKYRLPADEATKNDDGEWVPGAVGALQEITCRYEPNGKGATVASNDGEQVVYSGIVYLDVNALPIAYGTDVSVYNGMVNIFKGKAINFSNGQLNSLLWV